MLVKELRQGLKAHGFTITFVILQILLAIVVVYHALLYSRDPYNFRSNGLQSVFWTLAALQLLIATPLRALGALASERKANTLELIFMTGLSPLRICFGKWASLMFQTLLVTVALLPYGIVRYFFGGMNLIEELTILGWLVLASGVLTACALMLSGTHITLRIIALGVAIVFVSPTFVMIMVGMGVRGGLGISGLGIPLGSADWVWLLVVANALLLTIAFLSIAADTIAAAAENTALRLRLLGLGFQIVGLGLAIFGAEEITVGAQAGVGVTLSLLIVWVQLASLREPLRTHLQPFARFGPLGRVAALPFLPGWPSAVVFGLLAFAVFAVTTVLSQHDLVERENLFAAQAMAIASLLTPLLILKILAPRIRRFLFLAQAAFHVTAFCLMLFLNALARAGDYLGSTVWYALFPPLGLMAMADRGLTEMYRTEWIMASYAALGVTVVLALLLSLGYWRRTFTLFTEVAKARARRSAPLPEAISTS